MLNQIHNRHQCNILWWASNG